MKPLRWLLASTIPYAVFSTIGIEPVRADDTCTPTPADVCLGIAQLATTQGGVSGATRCWQLTTDTTDANACDHVTDETWKITYGSCITLRYRDDTTGVVTPQQADTITLAVLYDNTATVVTTLHNAAPPADNTDFSFCSTTTGAAGGTLRAGTYRTRITAVHDNVVNTNDYNINSDGTVTTGSISDRTAGALLGAMDVEHIISNAPPSGAFFAYGTAGDESSTITVTATDRWGDNNVETWRLCARQEDATLIECTASAEWRTGGTTTRSFVVDNTFPARLTYVTVDFEIVGNAVLTGLAWTYLVTEVTASGDDWPTLQDDAVTGALGTSYEVSGACADRGTFEARISTSVKWAGGMDVNGHCVEAGSNTQLRLMTDAAIFIAFARDTSNTADALLVSGDSDSNCAGAGSTDASTFQVIIRSDNRIQVGDCSGSGTFLSTTVSTGEHRLWLTRNMDDPTGSTTWRGKLDGTSIGSVVIGNVMSTVTDPADCITFAGRSTVAACGSTMTDFLDGAIYEVRGWESIQADALLDQVADPTDTVYRYTLQGSEKFAYFLDPAFQFTTDTLIRGTQVFKADPRIVFDKDGAGTFSTADDNAVLKVGSSSGAIATLFNRGETAYFETFILTARGEQVTRAMTFATEDGIRTTCNTIGSVTPSSGKFSSTFTVPTSGTCPAPNDQVGSSRFFRATNTDQDDRSAAAYAVSTLYFVDAHPQLSSTLNPDSYPTDDSTEDYEYIISSDTLHLFAKVTGVRRDVNIDTTGTVVTFTIFTPTGGVAQTFTRDTGSDGWTNPHASFSPVAPSGIWSFLAEVAYNGNTGSNSEAVDFLSAFTANLVGRIWANNTMVVGQTYKIVLAGEINDELTEPDLVPRINITRASVNGMVTYTTFVAETFMPNTENWQPTIDGPTYQYNWTPTQPGLYNIRTRMTLEASGIRTQHQVEVVTELPGGGNGTTIIQPGEDILSMSALPGYTEELTTAILLLGILFVWGLHKKWWATVTVSAIGVIVQIITPQVGEGVAGWSFLAILLLLVLSFFGDFVWVNFRQRQAAKAAQA